MVAGRLVAEEVAAGRTVVGALDQASFPAEAGFRLCEADLERWSVCVASPHAAEDLGKANLRVRQVLDTVTDRTARDLPRIPFASPRERTVEAATRVINGNGVSDLRMRHHLGGHGVFMENALISRMAA